MEAPPRPGPRPGEAGPPPAPAGARRDRLTGLPPAAVPGQAMEDIAAPDPGPGETIGRSKAGTAKYLNGFKIHK